MIWHDDPFWDFGRMAKEFRRFFDFPEFDELQGYREPLADIVETKDSLIVTIELPGVTKEDIKLNIKDDYLEVKVEKAEETKSNKEGFRRYERRYNGFYRMIKLPAKVDGAKADATYNNGILELKLPKISSNTGTHIKVK